MARRLPAWYVVASTNDRVCPAAETDQLCAELQRLGARCECAAPRPAYEQVSAAESPNPHPTLTLSRYQRQKLGAHGFGLTPKWTEPCGSWLRRELGREPSIEPG